jgi:hypothetical protein
MGRFLRKIFAVPIKTTSPIPNSVKGYASGINFDATQQGQSREMALKVMPQKKYKNFSPSLIFSPFP